MLRRFILFVGVLASLALAAGCSDTTGPARPATADNTVPTDEFGGYTTDTEQPAFGDSTLVASEETEEAIDDAIVKAPEVAALIEDSESGLFRFRAVWGQLRLDSTHTQLTDWTGSLTLSRGALVIRRLIAFELNQDGYFPRENRETVRWFSFTSVHHDGIEVELFVPPLEPVTETTLVVDSLGDTVLVIDTLPEEPVTLTFATGPYTRTFTLSELETLDTLVTLNDGNSIVFTGFQVIRHDCPRGMVIGQWGYDADSGGVFHGLWRGKSGGLVGYVRGHFSEDSAGVRTFYGKWINLLGQFEGFVRGTWGMNPNDNAADIGRQRGAGWFSGDICDSTGVAIGSVSGKYKAAPRFPDGWFTARWRLTCNEAAVEDNWTMHNDGM